MTTQVATNKIEELKDLFEKSRNSLGAVLPKHLPPERVIKIAISAVSRTPLLMQCTTTSILHSVMLSSQLGLEPGGPLGHAYLVPYKNTKIGKMECQLIPGYRGLMDLVRRSGKVQSIDSGVVYQKDKFTYSKGMTPQLHHEPSFESDPGPMIGVYAVAFLDGSQPTFEVMTKAEVDRIRARSKAKDSGPWVTDYDAMARKTVLRKLCKYLPMSQQLATAMELDSRLEEETGAGDLIDVPGYEVPDEPEPEPITPPQRKSEQAKEEPAEQATTPEPTNEMTDDHTELNDAINAYLELNPGRRIEDVLEQVTSTVAKDGQVAVKGKRALGEISQGMARVALANLKKLSKRK